MTAEELLERACRGTPIIEGNTATFVWHGPRAPLLIGDWTHWEGGTPAVLTQVQPSVWTYTLELPQDAYLEYAFYQDGHRVADPFNPHLAPSNPWHRNQYFYMPEGRATPLARRRRGLTRCTLTRHVVMGESLAGGNQRIVHLVRPPTAEPCPLLVMLDGQDYLWKGKILPIVENLLDGRRIRPVALALVYHSLARMAEYACDEATVRFVVEQVVPLAQANLNLLDVQARPGTYGIAGPSMAGLMSLYIGLRAPQIFGRILSQSGAFDFGEGDAIIWDLVQCSETLPLRIWMDAGRFEWLLNANRRMERLLRQKGYDATYHEYSGAHNWPSWRDELPRGLEHLFGTED